MDVNSIVGSALLMKLGPIQQDISISAMKMVANQQKQIADLLAQNTVEMPKSNVQNSGSGFSTYA